MFAWQELENVKTNYNSVDIFDKMLLIQNIPSVVKTHNMNVNWLKSLSQTSLRGIHCWQRERRWYSHHITSGKWGLISRTPAQLLTWHLSLFSAVCQSACKQQTFQCYVLENCRSRCLVGFWWEPIFLRWCLCFVSPSVEGAFILFLMKTSRVPITFSF